MEPVRGGLGMGVTPPLAASIPGVNFVAFDPSSTTELPLGVRAQVEARTKSKRWWIVGGVVGVALAAVAGWWIWSRYFQKPEIKVKRLPAPREANRRRRAARKSNPGRKRKAGASRKRNRSTVPSSDYRLKPSMGVQSLIFPKDKFSRDEAVSWAKEHGYKVSKVDETGSSFRLRQKQPGRQGPRTFRTIAFGKSGIKAVVAKAKKYKKAA